MAENVQDNLPKITHDMLCSFYDNGVTDGLYSGRLKGLDEFRNAILFYLDMPLEDQRKVFGYNSIYSNISAWNSNEFVDKINKYKEIYEQKLKVGDYVKDCSERLCVITNIDTSIHVIYPNGKTHKWKKNSRFTKMGYNSPLMMSAIEVLQDMEEKVK